MHTIARGGWRAPLQGYASAEASSRTMWCTARCASRPFAQPLQGKPALQPTCSCKIPAHCGAPPVLRALVGPAASLPPEPPCGAEYLPIAGHRQFCEDSVKLAYGEDSAVLKNKQVAMLQSLSGTGSCRCSPPPWCGDPACACSATACLFAGVWRGPAPAVVPHLACSNCCLLSHYQWRLSSEFQSSWLRMHFPSATLNTRCSVSAPPQAVFRVPGPLASECTLRPRTLNHCLPMRSMQAVCRVPGPLDPGIHHLHPHPHLVSCADLFFKDRCCRCRCSAAAACGGENRVCFHVCPRQAKRMLPCTGAHLNIWRGSQRLLLACQCIGACSQAWAPVPHCRANHLNIWRDAHVAIEQYPYYHPETRGLDFERM